MWTGNKPPPLPSSALQSSNNRQTARTNPVTPNPRDNELEALRQRGLTTLLNRHFTETTQKVALERAAADAAMADLQARKAQTSEFVPSKDGELSPLDALYVKVNQWQKETRKKERETLLLYQRYVNKFGASGQVQVPATPAAATAGSTGGDGEAAAAMVVTPSTPSWAKHDDDDDDDDDDSPHSQYDTPQAAAPPTSPTYVPTIAKKIEQALTEYLETGGIEMPSMELLGKNQTYQEVFAKHEAEFKNYYRRQLEQRGVDAKTSLRWSQKTPQEREDAVYRGPGATITNKPLVRNKMGNDDKLEYTMPSTPEEEENDLLVEDSNDVFASSSPYFVNEDFDDRSLVSGLTTLNSAETRRVLQDCERSVATFLRYEHEAIKRMMLEQEAAAAGDDGDESSSDLDDGMGGSSSDICSITKATDQAEHLVKEMQQILDDFTEASQQMMMPDDDEGEDDTTAAQKAGGRRYHTSNPDEYWVAYYDESYQREYYHERNTNRTQWDPPDVDTTSQSNSQSSPDDLLMYDQVMPESSLRGVDGSYERRGSRFEEYRRRRRRARKRRIMVAAAVAAVAVTMGLSRVAYSKYNAWLATRPVINMESKEKSPVVDLSMTPVSLMDTLRILETERWQLFEDEQQRRHRPWICNLPFAYVLNPRCSELANENPIFDLQALINAMLQ